LILSHLFLGTIKVNLIIESIELVTITFNDRSKIKDRDGNQLSTTSIQKKIGFTYIYISEEDMREAQIQAQISLGSILLTFLTSGVFSIITGTSFEATWLLLGTLQLISLTPLFNLNLPPNFREFSKNLAILHGEPQQIPNVFEQTIDKGDLKPFTPYFELMSRPPS